MHSDDGPCLGGDMCVGDRTREEIKAEENQQLCSGPTVDPGHLFRANRGPRPSTDGPPAISRHPRMTRAINGSCHFSTSTDSADGLVFPTKMKTFRVIKYLNIYFTDKWGVQKGCRFMRRFTSNSLICDKMKTH